MLKPVIYFTLLLPGIVMGILDYQFERDLDGWLKLHLVPATWQDAFINCYYEGAVLASPNNPEFTSALRSIMRRSELELSSIYIGANALFSPGDYFSIEGKFTDAHTDDYFAIMRKKVASVIRRVEGSTNSILRVFAERLDGPTMGVPLDEMAVKWNTNDYGEKPEDCLRMSENGKVYATTCKQWLPYVCFKKRDETSKILNECGTFDSGYNLHKSTGKCYKLHEEPRSWNMSYKICTAEGGHLVIINDEQEADIVTGLFPEIENQDPDKWEWEPMHIGLRDWNRDSTWLTIHGEKIENVYHDWAKGQPDNKGVNVCGSILRDGTLDDTWCTLELMFVCERDPLNYRFGHSVNLLDLLELDSMSIIR